MRGCIPRTPIWAPQPYSTSIFDNNVTLLSAFGIESSAIVWADPAGLDRSASTSSSTDTHRTLCWTDPISDIMRPIHCPGQPPVPALLKHPDDSVNQTDRARGSAVKTCRLGPTFGASAATGSTMSLRQWRERFDCRIWRSGDKDVTPRMCMSCFRLTNTLRWWY